MTQTVPDISPLMPMHQDPLLVIFIIVIVSAVVMIIIIIIIVVVPIIIIVIILIIIIIIIIIIILLLLLLLLLSLLLLLLSLLFSKQYSIPMRHKLCRSFHPWCPGVKNRCLLPLWGESPVTGEFYMVVFTTLSALDVLSPIRHGIGQGHLLVPMLLVCHNINQWCLESSQGTVMVYSPSTCRH